jgi:hypothetical protein
VAVEGKVEMTGEKQTVVGIVLLVRRFTLGIADDMCSD